MKNLISSSAINNGYIIEVYFEEVVQQLLRDVIDEHPELESALADPSRVAFKQKIDEELDKQIRPLCGTTHSPTFKEFAEFFDKLTNAVNIVKDFIIHLFNVKQEISDVIEEQKNAPEKKAIPSTKSTVERRPVKKDAASEAPKKRVSTVRSRRGKK